MTTRRYIDNWLILWAGISVLFFILVGCGYNPKDPAYDTVANPDKYPPVALSLLDDIESGELVASDSISGRFADLYTSESNLLDNPKWKQVIERLGARLSYKADSLVLLGLSHYGVAAGYYTLASFARPVDKKTALMAGQFGAWVQVVAEYDDSASLIIENRATVSDKIDFLRKFWNKDDLSRDFASSYLLAQLFDWPVDKEAISKSEAEALSPIDLALARVLGLTTYDSGQVLATFAPGASGASGESGAPDDPDAPDAPGIELVAARVKEVAKTDYLVEAYFATKARVDKDYTISVRSGTARGGRRLLEEDLAFVPFEAKPFVPVRQWRAGEVYAVNLRFTAPVEPTGVAIGIFETDSSPNRFLTVAGKQGSFVRIPGIK